jgi:hypothetical protein
MEERKNPQGNNWTKSFSSDLQTDGDMSEN